MWALDVFYHTKTGFGAPLHGWMGQGIMWMSCFQKKSECNVNSGRLYGHEKKFRDAFEEIKKIFPFENYVDASKYFAMYAVVNELQHFLPIFAGKRLLDIGSGPMDKTGILQMLGFDCYAVDDLSDPWHLRNENQTKIKNFAENIGISFYHQKQGEYTIPFEVNSFDVVCSFDVVEHLHESPRGLLNTMGHYASPGGLLVISMPNSVNLRKRISVLIGRTNYPGIDQFFSSIGTWRGHVREYTLSEANYICSASGFEILASRTFEDIAYSQLSTPLLQVYLLLGTLLPTLRSGLLVVSRKPKSWKPVMEDPEAYRRALERSVPKGVA
jgi:SAM-dependent methyltransferase